MNNNARTAFAPLKVGHTRKILPPPGKPSKEVLAALRAADAAKRKNVSSSNTPVPVPVPANTPSSNMLVPVPANTSSSNTPVPVPANTPSSNMPVPVPVPANRKNMPSPNIPRKFLPPPGKPSKEALAAYYSKLIPTSPAKPSPNVPSLNTPINTTSTTPRALTPEEINENSYAQMNAIRRFKEAVTARKLTTVRNIYKTSGNYTRSRLRHYAKYSPEYNVVKQANENIALRTAEIPEIDSIESWKDRIPTAEYIEYVRNQLKYINSILNEFKWAPNPEREAELQEAAKRAEALLEHLRSIASSNTISQMQQMNTLRSASYNVGGDEELGRLLLSAQSSLSGDALRSYKIEITRYKNAKDALLKKYDEYYHYDQLIAYYTPRCAAENYKESCPPQYYEQYRNSLNMQPIVKREIPDLYTKYMRTYDALKPYNLTMPEKVPNIFSMTYAAEVAAEYAKSAGRELKSFGKEIKEGIKKIPGVIAGIPDTLKGSIADAEELAIDIRENPLPYAKTGAKTGAKYVAKGARLGGKVLFEVASRIGDEAVGIVESELMSARRGRRGRKARRTRKAQRKH
jgi:hypothetical protein